jgi:trehalose/maltose hydrolase-like predicted phosphorylase
VQTDSGVSVALVAASRIEHPEGSWTLPPPTAEPGAPERWKVELDLGRTYRLDRIVCVQTSRQVAQPAEVAHERLRAASERGFEAAVEDHRAAWAARWAASDVVIDDDVDAQRAIRFAL